MRNTGFTLSFLEFGTSTSKPCREFDRLIVKFGRPCVSNSLRAVPPETDVLSAHRFSGLLGKSLFAFSKSGVYSLAGGVGSGVVLVDDTFGGGDTAAAAVSTGAGSLNVTGNFVTGFDVSRMSVWLTTLPDLVSVRIWDGRMDAVPLRTWGDSNSFGVEGDEVLLVEPPLDVVSMVSGSYLLRAPFRATGLAVVLEVERMLSSKLPMGTFMELVYVTGIAPVDVFGRALEDDTPFALGRVFE
uniref:Uncharacterized protein n=1 Tax=Anopheles culicifacies TaxID=139723 RepID=A0A182M1R1_9DIPT